MLRRLFLLSIPLLIATCSTAPYGTSNANPCATSTPLPSSNRPVICVDDRNLSHMTSNPYEAWARRNSPVKWYTVSGEGDLAIAFENEACVKKSTMSCRTGSCQARINGDAVYQTRCKYSITLTRNDKRGSEDPTVIIDDGVYVEGSSN
jgi:hypothetical protein